MRFVPDGQNADAALGDVSRVGSQRWATAGTKVDASTNGGTTAFSTATDTASITVTAVNDAPVLDAHSAVVHDDYRRPDDERGRRRWRRWSGSSISDVDTGAVEGIASPAGVRQRQRGSISSTMARLERGRRGGKQQRAAAARQQIVLRFVPDGANAGCRFGDVSCMGPSRAARRAPRSTLRR